MVAEIRGEYESEWAAMAGVAELLGVGTPETVRNWVRRVEVDAGARPGTTSASRTLSGEARGPPMMILELPFADCHGWCVVACGSPGVPRVTGCR